MTGAAEMRTVRQPLAARKVLDGRRLLLISDFTAPRGAPAADNKSAKALARAFCWRRE